MKQCLSEPLSAANQDTIENHLSHTDWPNVTSVLPLDDGYQFTLQIPVDLSFFSGHFPTAPILPGVVQVHWAACFAERYLNLKGHFHQLRNLKFFSKIEPLAELHLLIQNTAKGFNFTYTSMQPEGLVCKHSAGQFEWIERE